MMISFEMFEQRLAAVREAIHKAATAAGRKANEIQLLPVTKFHSVDMLRYCQRAQIPAVGENRVQEAATKRSAMGSDVAIELIGHLQSNKVRIAAETFDRIQSVDSMKLIRKLGEAVRSLETARANPLPVFLQFNTGEDPAKFGFRIDEAAGATEAILSVPELKLEGLMTVAPLDDNPAVARRAFADLRTLRDRLEAEFRISLPELSMGMTGDLDEAITEGSTQVRVGTALFGQRPPVAGE